MEKQGTRAHVAILVNGVLEGTSKACIVLPEDARMLAS